MALTASRTLAVGALLVCRCTSATSAPLPPPSPQDTPESSPPSVTAPNADTSNSRPLLFVEFETGIWGSSQGANGCDDNPHTIRFSEDGREMILTSKLPRENYNRVLVQASHYDVLEVHSQYVRMRLRDEQRTTSDGEPVVWDLFLRAPGDYCWRRADWPQESCTAPNLRCEARQQ